MEKKKGKYVNPGSFVLKLKFVQSTKIRKT